MLTMLTIACYAAMAGVTWRLCMDPLPMIEEGKWRAIWVLGSLIAGALWPLTWLMLGIIAAWAWVEYRRDSRL